MDEIRQGENPLGIAQWIQALPVEGDFLRQVKKAELAEMRENRADKQEAENWQHGNGELNGEREAQVSGGLRVKRQPGLATQVVPCKPAQEVRQIAAEVPEHEEASDQQAGGRQILAAHDLPF